MDIEQEVYSRPSCAASRESLLRENEHDDINSCRSSVDIESTVEKEVGGHRQPRKTRILGIAANIIVYIFAAWGVYALIVQLSHVNHRHTNQAVPHHHLNDVDHSGHLPHSQKEHHHDAQLDEHQHAHGDTTGMQHHHEGMQTQKAFKSCDCGSSITEAISRNCKYDSLGAAWLPPHCRDDELTAEFETQGPGPNGTWIYWSDKEHKNEITVEDIAAMGDDQNLHFRMSYEWHVVHCMYYWIKQFRLARTHNKLVEPSSDSEDHIRHCMMVIRNPTRGTVSGVALNTD